MSRWFRFYDEALNDPKVQMLPADDFKSWVNLLCLASQNDGRLPDITAIAFALRVTENAAITVVERLLNGGLIDKQNGGANGWFYAPHGWSKRQYKSDTSNERVKRYRDKKCNVTVTPPETDTDTDIPLSKDKGRDPEKEFWDNAKQSLIRSGKSQSQAGSLIGKWLRDNGKELTTAAINAAQLERAVDPVGYVQGYLRRHKAQAPPVNELATPC